MCIRDRVSTQSTGPKLGEMSQDEDEQLSPMKADNDSDPTPGYEDVGDSGEDDAEVPEYTKSGHGRENAQPDEELGHVAGPDVVIGAHTAPAPQIPDHRITLLDDTYEVAIIGVASLVEMIAAAKYCDDHNDCSKQNGYAVAVGVVSTFVCILFFSMHVLVPGSALIEMCRPVLNFSLLIWWTFGVGVLTFDKPFTTTGNGYFASWIAFLTSAVMVWSSHRDFAVFKHVVSFCGTNTPRERRICVALLASSLVEFVEATIICGDKGSCEKLYGFAVAAGCFSLMTTPVVLFLIYPDVSELPADKQHILRALVVLLGAWSVCRVPASQCAGGCVLLGF
eukprot:TRINITY_DN12431_c0_g1_i3.p1 TRINITY_DN12431_c0_g1~~TRINITY_DN12431_c0_g1_i3.p1  ORF type:complete len:337 (+),score=60.35 TRINITY_DN12431_c0_g1_i3:136-1146(+)